MNVKRIGSIFNRDLKSSRREFLLAYILLAPLLIAIGFRLFIPSVNAVSYQFALDQSLGEAAIEEFRQYGDVEVLTDSEAIEARVKKIDDIVGVTREGDGQYQMILEGNEDEGIAFITRQIINDLDQPVSGDYQLQFSDIGTQMSPLILYGASGVAMMAIIFGGMIIGLNFIEEKESETIEALNVSPMSKLEFIIGKSLIGVVFPILQVFIILWIFGVTDVNLLMVLSMTLVSSLGAVILGFLIGVISGNQMAGIANIKFIMMLVSASFVGAILLPVSKHFFLYWSPIYWTVMGFFDIISKDATWASIARYMLWIGGLTLLVFGASRKLIRKGMA